MKNKIENSLEELPPNKPATAYAHLFLILLLIYYITHNLFLGVPTHTYMPLPLYRCTVMAGAD